MNPWFAFILGLLIGWLIEWLIDFFYWRRRRVEKETVYVPKPPVQVRVPERGDVEPRPAPQTVPDDLKITKGIGSVIERK
jgi:hypothetical protein